MMIYVLSVYGKKRSKNIEHRPVNGIEPVSRKKGQIPTSNRLRPKECFERDGCARGGSDICDHSTNPVKAKNTASCEARVYVVSDTPFKLGGK